MPEDSKKSIVFTGGHAGSTAYATIEELQKRKDVKIYFIGGKSSVEGKKSKTFAQVGLPELGVEVISITTGRLQVKITPWTLPSLLKIPVGIVSAFTILLKVKPVLVVSFGGYAAFPVVLGAWLLRIPVILHEQTIVAGRANQISAFFADKIALARENSMKYFPKGKCVVTGNPIPANIKMTTSVKKFRSPPHLFVTGGISGSVAINNALKECLLILTKQFAVLHQTGELEFESFSRLKEKLNLSDSKYKVYGTLNPSDWGNYVEWADVFVSRSGANFVYQLMILKKPAVLIPIPNTYLDEQRQNALYAKDFGVADVLEQKQLNGNSLIQTLSKIIERWPQMAPHVIRKTSPDLNASRLFVELILKYL